MEQPSISTPLQSLQLQIADEPFDSTAIEDFKEAVTQLVKVTALILDLSVNPFSLNMYEKYMGDALKALCLAYLAYGLDIPADPEELWGDNTEPGMDLIKAKLVRYSSNLYAQAFSNPDTVLADNMDYDLRQYLMFLHLFVKKSFGLNLLVFADNELTD